MAEADPGKMVNVHEAKTHFSKRTGELPEMIEPLDHFDEAVLGESFRHLPVDRRHAIRAA
jgi:hypothetical protein